MISYHLGDLHATPDHVDPRIYELLDRAASDKANYIVEHGDGFDGARYQPRDFLDSAEIRKLLLAKQDCFVAGPLYVELDGNHDPLFWLRKHFAALGGVLLRHSFSGMLSTPAGQVLLTCTHGWKEYDIGLRLLAPIYEGIFEFFPAVYWWWHNQQATPARIAGNPVRTPKYWEYTLAIHNEAMRQTIKRAPASWTIFGHTHWEEDRLVDSKWRTLNPGAFYETGTYIVVDWDSGDVKFRRVGDL